MFGVRSNKSGGGTPSISGNSPNKIAQHPPSQKLVYIDAIKEDAIVASVPSFGAGMKESKVLVMAYDIVLPDPTQISAAENKMVHERLERFFNVLELDQAQILIFTEKQEMNEYFQGVEEAAQLHNQTLEKLGILYDKLLEYLEYAEEILKACVAEAMPSAQSASMEQSDPSWLIENGAIMNEFRLRLAEAFKLVFRFHA